MGLFVSHPTAFTTPAPDVFGPTPVGNPTNTGHDVTCVIAGNGFGNPSDVGTSIEWRAFQAGPGAVIQMTLKADWEYSWSNGSAIPTLYELDYSLNNGANWTVGVFDSGAVDFASGTFSLPISPSQTISQIRIRHEGLASVSDVETEFAQICIVMSNVRLEMLVADARPVFIM
jgi:hypothetical protein